MPRIYLALGTNEGDRPVQIEKALDALESALGAPPSALSDILETPAWGFEGPDFLNCAVRFDLPDKAFTPTRVLDLCQGIERQMGRCGSPAWDEAGRRIYHDRPIDIDLLFWGCRRIRTSRLTIPHPLIRERDFVLRPLLEIVDAQTRAAFPEIFEGID